MVDFMTRDQIAAVISIHDTRSKLSVQLGNTEILIPLNFEDFNSSTSTVDFDRHERIPAKRHSNYPVTLRGFFKVLPLWISRVAISCRPILVSSSAQKGTSISSTLSSSFLVSAFFSPSRASRTNATQASSQGL